MGVKRNFIYNSILTVSSYISTLLVFPYVSRVLGVENIGIVNYVDNIINYFILIANLGINAVGVREIAVSKADKVKLSRTFQSLCSLLLITTMIAILVLIFSFLFIPKLIEYRSFLWIGCLKLIFSVFLIDWFYKGMEDFDFVAKRTVAVKILYVILVYLFVRNSGDYVVYFAITSFTIVLNSVYNWSHLRKYIFLKFYRVSPFLHLKSMSMMASYLILNSLYSTFNVLYLGWVSGTKEVAYYTTAFNVYLIISAFFTAFTNVMIPRVSSMLAEGRINEIKESLLQCCNASISLSVPLTIFTVLESSNIILLLAGEGFEGAIRPMQLINFLICINGLSQIVVLQLLLPLKKDKIILIGSMIAASAALILDFTIVRDLGALGSAFVLIISVLLSNVIPWTYALKRTVFEFDYKYFGKELFLSVPYILICVACNFLISDSFVSLIIASIISLLYFIAINIICRKNMYIINTLPERVINLIK